MVFESYVSHLESASDGTKFEFGQVHTTHEGRPLLVSYDLDRLERRSDRRDLDTRAPDMWRYRELLPVGETVISLGEVMTPLLPCPRLAATLGLERLYVKDESRLPTGSFKARGMAVAITMACGLRITRIALPSAGNAGGAAAAYAARAGIECFVFMPQDTPAVNRAEAALHGARVTLVDGLIDDCARIVSEGAARMGWFDLSTLREPYRLEGKKTMGFELAEQLDWRLPDAIFYPTGGGTGLIAMWKAFQELAHIDWLTDPKAPRMYACQATGCAPLARAYRAGVRYAERFPNPDTVAAGLRVPHGIGDFMVLDAVRASHGNVMDAPDTQLIAWMRRASSLEGISICPETAVCFACLEQALQSGQIRPDESVVVFNTAAAQKYVELLADPELPKLTAGEIDWDALQD